MNVGVILAPESYNKSAPIHVGHILSLLNQSAKTQYIDYNEVPFYLYLRLLNAVVCDRDILHVPVKLLTHEVGAILARAVLETVLDLPSWTQDHFSIDAGLLEELSSVLTKMLDTLIDKAHILSKDVLAVVSPSPHIFYLLELLDRLREKDSDVPVMVVDYYNFDPVIPYLTAFLTDTNFQGDNIHELLQIDPLYPHLKEKVSTYADYIIGGEGYDVIRRIGCSEPIPATQFSWNGKTYTSTSTRTPLKEISRTPGTVTVLHSQPVDLDSLPFPDYSTMQSVYKFAQIEITRGCPCLCAFCEISAYMDGMFRRHSVSYLLDLLEHMKQYTFDSLSFWDTAINTDQEHTIAFLQQAKNAGFYNNFFAHLRSIQTDPRLVALMAETGCDMVAIGMESASEKVLADMHKNTRISHLEQLLPLLGDHDIKAVLYTMVGFPTETLDDVRQTIAFVEKVSPQCSLEITGSFYWIGLIQRLSYKRFPEFGIQCAPPRRENLPNSSVISCSPGLYTILTFAKGMDRHTLTQALSLYRDSIEKLGLPPSVPFFE